MKNYTITEEQIKKLSTQDQIVEEYLNEWFPEVFNPKLEICKWYISNDLYTHIFYVTKIEEDKYYYYGFNSGGQWVKNDYYSFNDSGLKNGFKLATKQEIQEALVKEAKRRNYEGRYISILKGSYKRTKSDKIFEIIDYDYRNFNNELLVDNANQSYTIFKDGVWAEILKEEVTLNFQQIADKFGIDVDQLKITKL